MKHLSASVLSASDATSQTSSAIDCVEMFSASFQTFFGDATAAGTMQIQASNDVCHTQNLPATFTPTNWTNIASATSTVTAGASTIILIPQVTFRWMRVVFTSSAAGSTTINTNIFALSY